MGEKPTDDEEHNQDPCYEIRIKGYLDTRWSKWFEDLTITLEDNGDTLLTGPVIDQAALHGLLKKVRDLGLLLVSVNPVERGLGGTSEIKPSNPIVSKSTSFKKRSTQ